MYIFLLRDSWKNKHEKLFKSKKTKQEKEMAQPSSHTAALETLNSAVILPLGGRPGDISLFPKLYLTTKSFFFFFFLVDLLVFRGIELGYVGLQDLL